MGFILSGVPKKTEAEVEQMKCPMCGIDNSDNWPLDIDGNIVEGREGGKWEWSR